MRRRYEQAFTLVEVMIALVIFFVAVFSILEMTTQSLKAARSLTQNAPNAGMLAADFSMTNRLEEGVDYGDFGSMYPGYAWEREVISAATNGLFRVDFLVVHNSKEDSRMSILLYRPESGQVSQIGRFRR